MNLLPRWMRPEARRQAGDREPDPGDMGTAFGLDASFGPADDPATSSAASPEDIRWQQRLDRRPHR